MEFLKKILRHALTEKSPIIRLAVDETPKFFSSDRKNLNFSGFAKISRNDFSSLFSFLFPSENEAASSNKLLQGALNIPNVGLIQIIAHQGDDQWISMYLPTGGSAAFETDWISLNRSLQRLSEAVTEDIAPDSLIVPLNETDSGGFIPIGFDTNQGSSDNQAEISFKPLEKTGLKSNTLTDDFSGKKIDTLPQDKQLSQHRFNVQNIADSSNTPDDLVEKSVKSSQSESINYETHNHVVAGKSLGQNPVDAILIEMIENGASDLHLTSGQAYCFRIDGDIQRMGTGVLDGQQMQRLLDPILPERNRREFLLQNDTDFAYEISEVGRFRVNIFRDYNGVGAVFRYIPNKILSAEQLSLPTAITKFCELNKGLVLVTGPTGSGKSTTLAAMIDLINKTRSDHILTIEDPIEFVHPQHRCLVNQREVHRHTTSFSRALRAALREDPDIILIGEMRDLETISIAIETAETGHLVFGTLHTTTAVSTIDRIIEQFPADRQAQIRSMLASSLRGVVAQTLVKKKTGGRVAAHEILILNDAVSAMIREGKSHMITSHMQSQKADGNQLLNDALLKLVKDGLVEPEEAYRKAVDKPGLLEALKRINKNLTAGTPPGGRPISQQQRPAS